MSFENSGIQTGHTATKGAAVRRPVSDLVLLILISTVFITSTLASPPIWHHGEAREGLVVQDIVRNHHWILPDRNGEMPSKPLLFHWIAAVFASALGLSDFTVRLPSALAAAIMMLATYSMGKFIGGRRTAWLAVGGLLGMYTFWAVATEARVDMIFSASITTALVAWFLWYRTGQPTARVISYVAVAAAVLSKGPAGIVLPGVAILGFLWMEGKLHRLRDFWSWPLVSLVLCLGLGWYLAACYLGGEAFWAKQIVSENFDQFFGTGASHTGKSHILTVIWLITKPFPWSMVLIWAVYRRVRGQCEDTTGHFLHMWCWGIVGVFLLASARRAVYLLHAYPAIALLAARELSKLLNWRLAEAKTPPGHFLFTGTFQIFSKKTVALPAIIGLLNLSLAIGTPLAHRVLEKDSSQSAMLARVAAEIPQRALVYVDPSISEPNLIVMSYRLNRIIDPRAVTCAGDYYFLSTTGSMPSCVSMYPALATFKLDRETIVLIHVSGTSADAVNS